MNLRLRKNVKIAVHPSYYFLFSSTILCRAPRPFIVQLFHNHHAPLPIINMETSTSRHTRPSNILSVALTLLQFSSPKIIMAVSPSPTPSGRNAQDVKVGPLQLSVPWLIPICIFSPFFLSFFIFVIHRHTVVRSRNKRAVARERVGEGVVLGKNVEK
jgi:hypothetical protein